MKKFLPTAVAFTFITTAAVAGVLSDDENTQKIARCSPYPDCVYFIQEQNEQMFKEQEKQLQEAEDNK